MIAVAVAETLVMRAVVLLDTEGIDGISVQALFAQMLHLGDQPLIVECLPWMAADPPDFAAAQAVQVAVALDLALFAAQPFESALAALLLVALALCGAGGVQAIGVGLVGGAVVGRLQRPCASMPGQSAVMAGEHLVTLVELADKGLFQSRGTVVTRHDTGPFGKALRVFGEYQDMSVRRLFEVIVDAFFLAQPVQQLQVVFILLQAQGPARVQATLELEAVIGGLQVVGFKQPQENRRYAQVAEGPASWATCQGLQAGHQHHLVMTESWLQVAAADLLNDPVPAGLPVAQAQQGRAMQQGLEVQGGVAQQFHFEAKGFVQGLAALEADDRQGVREQADAQ